MNKGTVTLLATAALLTISAIAPAQRFGFGYGRGYGWRRSYSGFGLGLGFGGYAPRTVIVKHQNAFTGDVQYVERAANDFRRDYERRKGDPLRIKADVQRLDETMEKVRREADNFGAVTDRGTDLMRDALDASDRIERAFHDANDPMDRRWLDVRRKVERLARDYRVD